MSRHVMIAPTTNPAESTPFRIPTFAWSPDQERNRTTTSLPDGTVVTNNYDGSERAPRWISLLLHAAQGQDLPADAEVIVEVKIADAIPGDGSPGNEAIPEQWEEIGRLTPTRKEWRRSFPIEECRVRKEQSDTPYGVVSFGLYGETASSAS